MLFSALPAMAQPIGGKAVSYSATPTVVSSASNGPITVQVTVGAGDTCLGEFSATPGAASGGSANWQPINGLNLITANSTATLPSPVQALRISLTAGTGPCEMDITGQGQ